jgi:phage terminase large subunit
MAGEFVEMMFSEDKQLQFKVLRRVQDVIAQSFQQDKSRVTQLEVRRRFQIVETLIRELRSDMGWAYERILDALPIALRCRLDGAPWDPTHQRNVWSPTAKL